MQFSEKFVSIETKKGVEDDCLSIAEDSKFIFSETSRGNTILIYKCYEYLQHRITSEQVVHWRCRQYKSNKCRTIMHTRGDAILKQPEQHTHPIAPCISLAKKATNAMKRIMKHPGVTPKMAIEEVIQHLPEDVKLSLPKKSSLTRTLQRSQRKLNFF
ncbi:hypothetical protein O3M35_011174 [Rhynocoris fuscipes]|uniref:FLYWCH-type domain-containing protein n=1 Tax=Rhynocoris fuscipes TaxID=488301 RepID=A0AAW1CVC6_9HEMI